MRKDQWHSFPRDLADFLIDECVKLQRDTILSLIDNNLTLEERHLAIYRIIATVERIQNLQLTEIEAGEDTRSTSTLKQVETQMLRNEAEGRLTF